MRWISSNYDIIYDLFIFSFILSNFLLELLPDFTATAAKEGVTDKIMDSRREQRNEIPNAKKK